MKSLKDSVNGVVLHGKEEAAAHLGLRSTSVEQSGSSMSKPFLTYQIISFDGTLHISFMNSDGNPHDHVLRPLHNLAVDLQQVRLLKSLEAKVVVVQVSLIVNGLIKKVSIVHYNFVDIFSNETRTFTKFVLVAVKLLNNIGELRIRLLMQRSNRDSGSQSAVVRMDHIQVGSCFSEQIVKF